MGITFNAIRDGVPLGFADERHLPNCNDANKGLVLRVLGFAPARNGDDYGECDATDFLGRILVALALLDDPELPPGHTMPRPHRFQYLGDNRGYLVRKLHELREHTTWCAAHGYHVQWA